MPSIPGAPLFAFTALNARVSSPRLIICSNSVFGSIPSFSCSISSCARSVLTSWGFVVQVRLPTLKFRLLFRSTSHLVLWLLMLFHVPPFTSRRSLTFEPFSPPGWSPTPSSALRFMVTMVSSANPQGFGRYHYSPWRSQLVVVTAPLSLTALLWVRHSTFTTRLTCILLHLTFKDFGL